MMPPPFPPDSKIMKIIAFLAFFLAGVPFSLRADFIAADFQTTRGDFTVLLDYVNSPLAVANFIHLAGKADDILETVAGVPDISEPSHGLRLYQATAESDVPRLPLNVSLVPETSDSSAYYGVYQSQTLIGGVELFPSGGFHSDITGEDRIRLKALSFNPRQYQITLRYPRPWLDQRDLRVKEARMYRLMKIHRLERGRRLFAGRMTDDRFEHPGYHFQDEVARNPGNLANPYGAPFHSPGVLAMDSPGPNRNGSGFFITTVAEPSFNGRYTAFGSVLNLANLQVVQSIVNTPVDDEGRPTEEIFIIEITIRRSGFTANAFFEGFQQQYLPGQTSPLPLTIERGGGEFSLVSALRPLTQNAIYGGTDLRAWSGGTIEAQRPGAVEGSRLDLAPLAAFSSRYFFKGFATELPGWPSAEWDPEDARLFFSVRSGNDRGTMNLYFGQVNENDDDDDSGLVRVAGTYNIDMIVEQTGVGSGSVFVPARGSGSFFATYDSSRGPYEGRLSFSNVTGPLNADRLTLHFDSGRLFNNPQVDPRQLIRRFSAVTMDSDEPILNYDGVFQILR